MKLSIVLLLILISCSEAAIELHKKAKTASYRGEKICYNTYGEPDFEGFYCLQYKGPHQEIK